MDIEKIYKDADAYLEGHFLLSSGKHSMFYLQSAKVLENPKIAEKLAQELAKVINQANIKAQSVCAPALGGILAGYELARALSLRSIFTERVDGKMALRRGFNVTKGEKFIICEDIITTGGSALESARTITELGGEVVAFAALANRGFCARYNSGKKAKPTCKLPNDVPFFALEDFEFEIFEPSECPMCKNGSKAVKPGSRGN
ncbi:MAG: orotate phosphoribosyltransferase [Campylobacteraceae bacterium]|jgi:orotate phosphoribosyltransferase|nr:orotate phosphoribosyltransferase [Campylobacteraceae bacterium]